MAGSRGPGPVAHIVDFVGGLGDKLLAQPAAAGALPMLYAATMPDVHGGAYYVPDGLSNCAGTRPRPECRVRSTLAWPARCGNAPPNCPASGRTPRDPAHDGGRRKVAVVTVAPDGRKLLRLEVRNSETPIEKKPSWIRTRARMGPEYTELKKLVHREGLHTVCEEAGCPNIYECWEDREATFLIGGDQCTRRCDFCQIDTGRPAALDRDRAAQGRRVGAGHGPALRDGHRCRP